MLFLRLKGKCAYKGTRYPSEFQGSDADTEGDDISFLDNNNTVYSDKLLDVCTPLLCIKELNSAQCQDPVHNTPQFRCVSRDNS